MFPLVALATVGLSAVLVRTVQSLETPLIRCGAVALTVAGLGWTVTQALAVWPEGLCYVNPLWGGMERGYRLVSEANYDWGQGLKQLGRWQRRHHIDNLCVWYFGTDPAIDNMPVQRLHFHRLPIHNAADVLRLLRGQRLAATATLVYGNVPVPAVGHIRAVLGTRKPLARVGTFLIYDFSE